ncbi:MAG: cation:proton antiporter [Amphiplicatus sp.]
MQLESPLVTTLVAGIVLAFLFGALANRFKLPPLVGYLIAGVAVGPYTPGFVANQSLGGQLADIGVVLLMFGVGLQFSPKDLMSVRALAIPGTIGQILLATPLGMGLGLALGWDIEAALLFGFALVVTSTVVLLKALQDRRLVETERGRLAVGWAIAEDLATVFALVMIPAIASLSGAATLHDPLAAQLFGPNAGLSGVLTLTLLKIVAFIGLMLVIGKRFIPWALHATAHTGSRELFRLAVLAIALGAALGSSLLFGVSLAIGAFFAGMILAESELSQRAAQETLPLRDAFAVLFFVSVGMLFDPTILLRDPLALIATVFIIVVARSAIVIGLACAFRHPVATGLTIAASRAQIGEFSFIMASLGVALGVLPERGQDLIIAGALISIILNPALFWLFEQLETRLPAQRRKMAAAPKSTDNAPPAEKAPPQTAASPPEAARTPDAPKMEDEAPSSTTKSDHAIIIGYGRVGKAIARGLADMKAPFIVIEDAADRVEEARAAGFEVIVGNGAASDTLNLANIRNARSLMVAIPTVFEAGAAAEQGRKLNPDLWIIVRAHSENEEAHLKNLGASVVVLGGQEIGLSMLAQRPT